jgi:F-type H+-transporting ATPase subunit epsilon
MNPCPWKTKNRGKLRVLVKTGAEVLVSVRRAIRGTDLGQLRATVEREFLILDEREQEMRAVMAKLESGFLRRFVSLQHD